MHIPAGLQPHFRAIGVLSVLALVGDTWLSSKFGASISWEMAPILAVISMASGLLLVAALFFIRLGWRGLGYGLAAAWVPVFAFNCWSNMGVSTANRMGEVQAARVQQTTYDGAQANVTEAKASLDLFNKQLANLLEANKWAATVTADGLRNQIAELRKSEIAESRLGGCGRKCRAIQDQIASVQGQIAVAEQRADLTQRIDATKRVIASARTKLASTDKGISATANQSSLYAKLISFNLAADPSNDMVTVANEGTGIATAIILAIIAAALTLAGAWPHLMTVNSSLIEQFNRLPDDTPPVREQSGNRTSEPARAYPIRQAEAPRFEVIAHRLHDLRRIAAQTQAA